MLITRPSTEFEGLPSLDGPAFGDRKKKKRKKKAKKRKAKKARKKKNKAKKRAAGKRGLGKRVRLGKVHVPKHLRKALKYTTRGGTTWAKPHKKDRGRKGRKK